MLKAFKFRLYPSTGQEIVLGSVLESCRLVYNAGLEERKREWEEHGKSVTCLMQLNALPVLKQQEGLRVHSQVLQDVLRRLDKAFKGFFRRVKNGEKPGFPRFKAKGRYCSFTFPQSGFKLEGNRLRLSKIGEVRVFKHREIIGVVKTCTVKRDSSGAWFVIFIAELPDVPRKELRSVVGVDVGVEKLVTLSTGETVGPPRFLSRSGARLKRAQRVLSRKVKGSRRREKARLRVARLHCRVANQRDDFLHKLSRVLVTRADLVVFENLGIKEMLSKSFLAQSISDCAWGRLMQFTVYKAEEAGKAVDFIDPMGTSQECSSCGVVVRKSLSERVHRCACGLVIDRDLNAALNILQRKVGTDGAELKPVETRPLRQLAGASLAKEAGSPRP
jgi:putative transposase